jgi:hypothetical protein
MYLSSTPSQGVTNLEANSVVCNVAIDLFADQDPKAATVESDAGYEIMIWFARFGSPSPLGYSQGKIWTQTIGDDV